MNHQSHDLSQSKGWHAGPWNSGVTVAIGYANEGVNEPHLHETMYEDDPVTRGTSVAVVGGQQIQLKTADVLVVEPNEAHTFIRHSDDYHHFVIQTPFVPGDKVLFNKY
jgi:quercetin dioxygenase-like cupin family protein